jgi:hypothetical protein
LQGVLSVLLVVCWLVRSHALPFLSPAFIVIWGHFKKRNATYRQRVWHLLLSVDLQMFPFDETDECPLISGFSS